jgi:hypothetical protein
VSADLFDLVQRFSGQGEVTFLHSYQLLRRILKEHCTVTEAKDDTPALVSVKPSEEVPSHSLQNPSDPDAGYDGHKGQGYQVQIMETYCDQEDKEVKSQTLNLITHIEVEPAHESDAHALLPALESTKDRGLAPKEVLADSLYGSDENCRAAEAMGVEVISPTMGSSKEGALSLKDFTFGEPGKLLSCPRGYAPVRIKIKKNRHRVAFNSEQCNTCPLITECPVTQGKKHHYLRFDDKALRIAQRRAKEQSREFKDRYRWRAGIEGSISTYDTRTRVKQLRVRGLKAVRFCATLKAVGINILRATAVRKAINASRGVLEGMSTSLYLPFLVFKEHFGVIVKRIRNIFTLHAHNYHFEIKMAA